LQKPSDRWRPLPRWESPPLRDTSPPSCKWVRGDESVIVLIVPAVSASYIDKSGGKHYFMAVLTVIPPRSDREGRKCCWLWALKL
jgi:hypothetical protein